MEAAVLVGVMTLVNSDCQAPGEPPPAPQALPVPLTNPLVSTFRHWVLPVMVFKVKAPATVTAPLNREVPRTPSVVLGAAVPMPTLDSLTFTTRVLLVEPMVVEALMIVVVATAKPQLSAGVVVAMLNRPETLRLLSMVEEPVTKMPAAGLVGLRVLAMPGFSCQAPFWPEGPQARPVPLTKPLVSTFKHWVLPRIELRVKSPVIVAAPLNLEVPRTPKVVEGAAVPMPTLLSLTFTIRVLLVEPMVVEALMIVVVATAKPQLSAGVVVAMLNRPETLRLLSMVEEPVTKMPAAVLVGLRVLAMPGFSCQAPFWPEGPQARPVPLSSPLVSTFRHWVLPRMELRVKSPVIVAAPLNLEVPRTPSVVEGAAVPMPTLDSLTFTTRVLLVEPMVVEALM